MNRILKAQKVIRELDNTVFSAKEMRGLSKTEKEFIEENNFNVTLTQRRYVNHILLESCTGTYYMFIARNKSNGKKQLYAIKKRQSLVPNEKKDGLFNYEKWLVFDARRREFCDLNFERRFCEVPPIKLIFA